MKLLKILFYISTVLLTLLMMLSAGMYFFKYEMVTQIFTQLGFPTYIVYPLAVAKILGLIAIWTNFSESLTEWAYAGFFFDFVLALSAHLNANDGGWLTAVIALVLLFASYFSGKIIKSQNGKPLEAES
ncbi:MAG: DoxX family protein [Blastocatellia bacterium]|nr:DoxX family protein [Blastocatellia bacterium]